MSACWENAVSDNRKASQNELGEVRPCDCGGVNLSMGPMTLHFAPEEVDTLYELVHAAREMVAASGQSTKRRGKRRRKLKVHGSLH